MKGGRSSGTGVFHISHGYLFYTQGPESALCPDTILTSVVSPGGIAKPEGLDILFIKIGFFQTGKYCVCGKVFNALIKIFSKFNCMRADNINISHSIEPLIVLPVLSIASIGLTNAYILRLLLSSK
jgi:hypothetical protein